MNRRQFLNGLLLFGGGTIFIYSGLGIYRKLKKPDLSYLNRSHTLIAELAELIIPKTDTPGAKEVHSELMIIHLVNECYAQSEQNLF